MARGPGDSAKKRAEIAERRRRVAALYTRRINQEDIARQVGVDQSTVSKDIKAMLKEWREGALSDIADVRARELGELDEIERDCALQFAASKDPGWIDRRLKCKERRSKLLGLDAPERKEVTGKDGGPLALAIIDRILADADGDS